MRETVVKVTARIFVVLCRRNYCTETNEAPPSHCEYLARFKHADRCTVGFCSEGNDQASNRSRQTALFVIVNLLSMDNSQNFGVGRWNLRNF